MLGVAGGDGSLASVVSVALEAAYGSHEAFTRAFRDQFGLTPDFMGLQLRPFSDAAGRWSREKAGPRDESGA